MADATSGTAVPEPQAAIGTGSTGTVDPISLAATHPMPDEVVSRVEAARHEGYEAGYSKGYDRGFATKQASLTMPADPAEENAISVGGSSQPATTGVRSSSPPRAVVTDPHLVDYAPAEISSPSTDPTLPPAESSPADPNRPYPDRVAAVVHTDPDTGKELSPAKPGGSAFIPSTAAVVQSS